MLESSKVTNLCCRRKRGRSKGGENAMRSSSLPVPVRLSMLDHPPPTRLPRFTFGTHQRSTKSYKARNKKHSKQCRPHSHIISFVHLVVSVIFVNCVPLARFSSDDTTRVQKDCVTYVCHDRVMSPKSVCGPASKHINLLECGNVFRKENLFL